MGQSDRKRKGKNRKRGREDDEATLDPKDQEIRERLRRKGLGHLIDIEEIRKTVTYEYEPVDQFADSPEWETLEDELKVLISERFGEEKQFGAASKLDLQHRRAILETFRRDNNTSVTPEQVLEEGRRKIWEDVRKNAAETQALRDEMSLRAVRIHGHKDFNTLRQAHRQVEALDTGTPIHEIPVRISDKEIKEGFDVVGHIPPLGHLWKTRKNDEDVEILSDQLNLKGEARTQPPPGSARSWKRMWEEAKDAMANKFKGLMRFVTRASLIIEPCYSFPVEQGKFNWVDGDYVPEKLRGVHDFRPINKFVQPSEKMRIAGNSSILAMIASFQTGRFEEHPFQNNDDILKDVATKHVNAFGGATAMNSFRPEHKEEARKLRHQAGLAVKYQEELDDIFMERSDEYDDLQIAKLDFSGYYHQFLCSQPSLNTYALWDFDESEWKYVRSDVMLFGSLSSVYICCRCSELLASYLNNSLGIPCVIYIDDTIIVAPRKWVNVYKLLALEAFHAFGFAVSEKKVEVSTECEDNIITVLGMNYKMMKGKVDYFPPAEKVEKTEKLAEECKAAIDRRKLTLKQLQKLIGNLTWVTSHQRYKTHRSTFRALYFWASERNFTKHICSESSRVQLKHQISTCIRVAKELKPLTMSFATLTKKARHFYSDAALEPEGAIIGGFIRDDEGHERCFSAKVDLEDFDFGVPNFKPHIGHYEMLAATVSVHAFADVIQNGRAIHHVDNVGDVYQLVDGFSRDVIVQVFLDAYWAACEEFDISPYLAFTSTKLNVADYLTREDLTKRFHKAFPEAECIDVSCHVRPELWRTRLAQYSEFLGHHVTSEMIRKADKIRTAKTALRKVLSSGEKKRKLGNKWTN